ncbi:hypothetical protein [Microvirga tunisiensis]|uniref:Uncharacterized protein n=1 Tax=Microvirga tunisiensis TaxID=2108360 RepID=A0A5N7MFP9_9HYPH|nr:hypothetical protein [Microvirga tunisiensis]MPR07488.1 hypothetical protein [Microvirga tunisiensis]MPR25755.1 hypothetical protein [Microvirga tunisiensis]
MPIALKTQAFHSQFVFKRRTMMNVKAPCLSVVRTDSALAEDQFTKASMTGSALSKSTGSDALSAFSKLLWALGSGSSFHEVEQIAEQWVEAVGKAGAASDPDEPKSIVENLLIGAQACMWQDSRHPARRH